MKKLISICLILSLAFLFASCDPNTSIQDSAKDPNVPSASEFKSEATDDELKLMSEMYKVANSIEANNVNRTYKCLDGATVSNLQASGELKLSSNTSSITSIKKCSCSMTIGDQKYFTDDFVVYQTKNTANYEGSVTINGSKKEGEVAFNIIYNLMEQIDKEGKNIEMYDSYDFSGTKDGYNINGYTTAKYVNDKMQGEEYFKIENKDHKMTLGIKENENKKEFLYLSLDGKYFDESVYNKMIKMQ